MWIKLGVLCFAADWKKAKKIDADFNIHSVLCVWKWFKWQLQTFHSLNHIQCNNGKWYHPATVVFPFSHHRRTKWQNGKEIAFRVRAARWQVKPVIMSGNQRSALRFLSLLLMIRLWRAETNVFHWLVLAGKNWTMKRLRQSFFQHFSRQRIVFAVEFCALKFAEVAIKKVEIKENL